MKHPDDNMVQHEDRLRLDDSLKQHSLQRKAAITGGGGTDHAGQVSITPIKNFDLDNTIFSTLEGALPRMFMTAKIAKHVQWDESASKKIQQEYQDAVTEASVPVVDSAIIQFMEEECDFSSEHADGTFLEHLLFCHDYSALHFPKHSPVVMLLHSILGTGTNTFAMEASKIPALGELISEFEMRHIEAFPSFLRLLYQPNFLGELDENIARLDTLDSISYHRVIDNQRLSMPAEDFWIQLNYHLVHYVDFLPAANWPSQLSDPVMQSFIDLSNFLDKAGKRMARVAFPFPRPSKLTSLPRPSQLKYLEREELSFGGRLSSLVPTSVKKKLAAKSIRKFSECADHSLEYELFWNS